MICGWLANSECLFPGKSKIYILEVRRENIFDVHTEYSRIRKEIPPNTKASVSEKLTNIGNRTSQTPHLSVLQMQQKVAQFIYIYIYIYMLLFQ